MTEKSNQCNLKEHTYHIHNYITEIVVATLSDTDRSSNNNAVRTINPVFINRHKNTHRIAQIYCTPYCALFKQVNFVSSTICMCVIVCTDKDEGGNFFLQL